MTRNEMVDQYREFSKTYVDEIFNLVSSFHESSEMLERFKYSETEKRLQDLVDSLMSLLSDYHERELSGELSRSEVQKLARDVIRQMRYDGTNYFWIDTVDYINVINPANTDTEGTSRIGLKDHNGQYIVKDLVDGAMRDGSFPNEYFYPKATSDRLEDIAEGDADLTQRITVRTKDETGRLATGFNMFVESLQRILQNVKGASAQGREVAVTLAELTSGVKDEIKVVSDEVANVNNQASEEASAVEQSSAAVEEMVASIQSISTIAQDRVALADTLASVARSGEEQMATTLSDIDGISTSADAIREVVTVIDNISSQINLLAMNAAIEAAHAGEAGRVNRYKLKTYW